MANEPKKRLLSVPRSGPGECTKCGRKFTGKTPEEVLAKFRAHTCDEDFSQAAARIVKEATER